MFTIHSPITFLMALWVHRHLHLKEEEVIVISAGYKLPISFGKVIPAFPDTQCGTLRKLTHFNVGRAFDKYVSTYIGNNPFTAYIDIMHTYQKLLVTHENCRAFHFMEEGTDSYMQAVTLEDFTRTAVSENFRMKSSKALLKELVRTVRGAALQDLTEAVGLGGASLRTATTWETARGRDSQAKCLVNQQF